MKVLGIETSCDDTAVAVVESCGTICSQEVFSQHTVHQQYGGVVPELASRSHIQHLGPMIDRVMLSAELKYDNLDGVAATCGPGLIGGVLVGMMMAKGIAVAANKPFLAINHLEGHALTARLTHQVTFPFLLFLLSGGHCQILQVNGVGQYVMYGQTLDDAIGESFDKVGRMMDLGYPGGPEVEKSAISGDPKRFTLPRPMMGRLDFSLSGLKTAVKRLIEKLSPLSLEDKADISACFQVTISDIITNKLEESVARFRRAHPHTEIQVVLAGGVAANMFLRDNISRYTAALGCRLIVPEPQLCTDNAVMIAWAGIEKLNLGQSSALDFSPRSRWPLYE